MLVSFSGTVGCGKTTSARYAEQVLKQSGLPTSYLRFQHLECFHILRTAPYLRLFRRQTSTTHSGPKHGPSPLRKTGYRQETLGLSHTLGYILRIVAFRTYRLLFCRKQWMLLDRYFYDSFPLYRLVNTRELFYLSILNTMIPVPDLAILLTARSETISKRRRNYSTNYINLINDHYGTLTKRFPEMVPVATDSIEEARGVLNELLQKLVMKVENQSDRMKSRSAT